MNFPSTEFDDAVAAVCQGTASEAGVAELHATLQAHEAARDDYLWQVELHSYLASLAPGPTAEAGLPVNESPRPRPVPARSRLAKTVRRRTRSARPPPQPPTRRGRGAGPAEVADSR